MNQRVDRLIALCKLWSAVKYFHPYRAYRQDIDWDAALVAVIPKVGTAQNAGEYATAVKRGIRCPQTLGSKCPLFRD